MCILMLMSFQTNEECPPNTYQASENIRLHFEVDPAYGTLGNLVRALRVAIRCAHTQTNPLHVVLSELIYSWYSFARTAIFLAIISSPTKPSSSTNSLQFSSTLAWSSTALTFSTALDPLLQSSKLSEVTRCRYYRHITLDY